MKKFLALLLALVMVFALAACGEEPAAEESPAAESPAAESTAPETEESTEIGRASCRARVFEPV